MKDHDDPPSPSPHPADDVSTLPYGHGHEPVRVIGPYRLLECVGRGGMGEVYVAEQTTPIRRRVAVKLIKAGMDSREVIARFESERQALALMNHPNVARIYDAGTTDAGLPYFVMEYVPGEPITEYCDRHKLDLRGRLELFIPVCQAIHHAHQKGIIHRDIKPNNVLVAVQDGRPVPKVIDFGVAKATQQTLTERTLYTAQGRLIGTPAYMSPEQAEMTGLNVDTTSDVYSLGVLLYELLVGAPPFDTKALLAAGIGEINRIIREVEPPRPSTKVDTLGERATEIAAKRRAEPRTWRKQLHGELDWITMRAIEKDRTRRYRTAFDLGVDVQMYLENKPVVAGPPGFTYRTRKLVKRNRGRVLLAACIVVLIAAVYSSVRLRNNERRIAMASRIDLGLDRIVARDVEPDLMSGDWTQLNHEIKRRLRDDPDSDLAKRAIRAAVSPRINVLSFGLVGDPPTIDIDCRPRFDPGRDLLYRWSGTGRWDDGQSFVAYVNVARYYTDCDTCPEEFRNVGSPGLARLIPAEMREAGVHTLEFAMELDIYDVDRRSGSWGEPGDGSPSNSLVQTFGRSNVDKRDLPVLYHDKYASKKFTISLYDQYPDDFPRAIEDVSVNELQWIRFHEVVVYKLAAVDKTMGRFEYASVFGGKPMTRRVTKPPETSILPGGFAVVIPDDANYGGLLPLAAIATVFINEDQSAVGALEMTQTTATDLIPVARFSLYSDPGAGNALGIMGAAGKTSSYVRDETGGYIAHESAFVDSVDADIAPVSLATIPDDGLYTGQIDLVPSRDLAVATRRMDRYLDLRIRVPVRVRITTVPARRIAD